MLISLVPIFLERILPITKKWRGDFAAKFQKSFKVRGILTREPVEDGQELLLSEGQPAGFVFRQIRETVRDGMASLPELP